MSFRVRSIFCASVSVLALVLGCTQKKTPPFSTEPCLIDTDGARLAARCGQLGDLKMAVLEATVARDGVPLVFVPGGPGQSAFDALAQLAPAFDAVRKHHDIIAFEREPLKCSARLAPDASPEAALANAKVCAAEIGERAALASTEQSVADVVQIAQQLGTKVAVYGASYGTRVALEVMRSHPHLIDAAVLDGVLAPETVLIAEPLVAADAALGEMRAPAEAVRAMLPRDVETREPRTGERVHVVFTASMFEDAVRGALYSREMTAVLPRLLREADLPTLAALALQHRASIARTINPYVYYSVVCREDVPFAHATEPSGFFREHGEALAELCAIWPVRPDTAPRAAVTSDVRTLLISGERDPVTPPSSARHVAETLSRSTQIILPAQGHINVYRSCVPRLVAGFIDETTPLDTTCVQRATALPDLDGANGP